MPQYTYRPDAPKEEVILAERVITEREAAEMLGVDRAAVYFRVVHELPAEGWPWAVVRIQAVKRGG